LQTIDLSVQQGQRQHAEIRVIGNIGCARAIDALEAGRTPLLISHAGEGATSDAQTKIFDALKAPWRSQIAARQDPRQLRLRGRPCRQQGPGHGARRR
jgi:hypothetical protein